MSIGTALSTGSVRHKGEERAERSEFERGARAGTRPAPTGGLRGIGSGGAGEG